MRTVLLLALLQACSSPVPEPKSDSARKPAQSSKPAAPAPDDATACVQVVLVQHNDGTDCADCIERGPAEAERRARELQQRLDRGEDFAALARTESDAPFGPADNGVVGTYRRREWPEVLAAIRDPLFALKVGEIARQPIAIDYGYVLVRRCVVGPLGPTLPR